MFSLDLQCKVSIIIFLLHYYELYYDVEPPQLHIINNGKLPVGLGSAHRWNYLAETMSVDLGVWDRKDGMMVAAEVLKTIETVDTALSLFHGVFPDALTFQPLSSPLLLL